MPTIHYPTNPNTDTAFVEQDGGTKNRALMIAPQDISTLELPNNPNSTKGYITVDGKKQRVILTADITGGGGGGSSLPDQTGHSGEFLTTDGTDASWAAVDALPDQTGNSGKFLTTDGTSPSWSDKPLVNVSSETSSIGINSSSTDNALSKDSVAVLGYVAANSRYSVSIGNGSQARAQATTAVGYNARATTSGAISIGSGTASAERAYQIGYGTNNTAHSLSVGTYHNNTTKNYQLLDLTDGTIPTARLTNAINKYSSMPTAGADYLGQIAQFTGTTDANYTHGYIYECVSDGQEPATYSWAAVSVQAGGSSLPSQTGNSGKFLTTDGTSPSWSNKPLVNTATGTYSVVSGSASSSSYNETTGLGAGAACSAPDSVAIGRSAIVSGGTYEQGSVAIGKSAAVSKRGGIGIGYMAQVTARFAIQLNSSHGFATNSDANTFKVANDNGNFEIMSANGTIPTARLTKVNTTVTIAVADWNGGTTVTKTVNGITATGVVMVAPDPTDQAAYTSAGILCTAQAANSLTFTCSTTPTSDIDVNIVCL